MSKEQINELKADLDTMIGNGSQLKAEKLYAKGWRKQSEGENIASYPTSAFECSICHWSNWDLLTGDGEYNFCPNCGAKMKGGAE